MGTYGFGPFESDDASEFTEEILNDMRDPLSDRKQTVYRLMKPVYDVLETPIESSQAIARRIVRHRGKRFRSIASDHYTHARAAIGILVFAHEITQTKAVDKLRAEAMLVALEKMRSDKVWLENWKNPEKVRAELASEIRAVKKLLLRKP